MATYKFVNADQLDSDLYSIGDAIRAKAGTNEWLAFPTGMVSAIGAISTGVGLNFDVIGNTPLPSSATENTIWIDTSTTITSWIFSATQPASPTSGMVWFPIGTEGVVEFNALEENAIKLCPLSASQYIGGAWVTKVAKSYYSGGWHDWIRYDILYDNGDENNDVTGGWVSEPKAASAAINTNALTLTRNADSMTISQTKSVTGGIARTANKVNLNGYSKLVFTGGVTGSGTTTSHYAMMCIWTDIGDKAEDNRVAWSSLVSINAADTTVEVAIPSDVSTAYVGFFLYHTYFTITMKSLTLV